jgi:phosphoenolpyruvate phosphomutase
LSARSIEDSASVSIPQSAATGPRSSPGAALRAILAGPDAAVIVGVFDGLSARIAEAAGSVALWASGLCMSTAMGVRDSDEASWTDLLGQVARIVAATSLPVLVDGDTGYGNFNNARRFAAQAERVGAAGVCFEDKMYPKMNSFVGDAHRLAPVGEFCGKLAACRDALRDSDFVVMARVEALIAGAGMEEALRRAEAYRKAGADAIFIHSRQPTIAEIAEFAAAWDRRLPLMIAPTTYYATRAAEYTRLGINGVIWANQSMRAAVSAMRRACDELLGVGPVQCEPWICSLDEVFELFDYDGLAADERRYAAADGHIPTPQTPR